MKRLEGAHYCHVYEIEINNYSELQVKNFHGLEEDWLDYVVANRTGQPDSLVEDVIIGPVADDSVGATVSNYTANAYGDIGTTRAKQIALELLKLEVYTDQIVLKTDKALRQSEIRGIVWSDK